MDDFEEDEAGKTPLHYAAASGNVSIVTALVNMGFNVNDSGRGGVTALMEAAKNNNVQVCQWLLRNGASVDQVDNEGNSAMHYAARLGHVQICRLLLDQKANVDLKNGKGDTALHVAAQEGHVMLAHLLVESDASIKVTNVKGQTAMAIALANSNIELGKFLTECHAKAKKGPQDESRAGTLRPQDGNAAKPFTAEMQEENEVRAAPIQAPSSSTAISVSPERFSREFEELSQLGKGEFGTVLKVKQKKTNMEFAVKRLNISEGSDEGKRKILNEAQILKRLDHENIIKYHDAWMEDNPLLQLIISSSLSGMASTVPTHFLYIQTELCKEKTLKDRLDSGELNDKTEQLIVMKQIVSALDYTHSLSEPVMHRDLKPENIFFSLVNQVKVGDFGGATLVSLKRKGTAAVTSIKHKTYVGTVTYMSPEQLNSSEYGRKSEIFTLGLIFYEILATFYGNHIERNTVFQALRSQRFTSQEFEEKNPKELKLIKNMLKENPQSRPSAAEVNQDVSKLLE